MATYIVSQSRNHLGEEKRITRVSRLGSLGTADDICS